MPPSPSRLLSFWSSLALLGLAAWPALAASAATGDAVARAQELIDAGRAAEALALLEKHRGRDPEDGRALLLRSTAHILLGDNEAGRRDLDRALELDPNLRQGWLNRAALDIAEERYERALAALETAERLDPAAPDNHLNLGAVLLFSGRVSEAAERFGRYLAATDSAHAYYLVASNYASRGYAALAVEHLARAIQIEEASRLSARTDPNFLPIAETDAYRRLLAADPPRPQPGAYFDSRRFGSPYDGAGGPLLSAVLSALQLAGEPFDARVEVTERWAVIWGDLRIEVRSTAAGEGLVEVSAPAERITPEDWSKRSEALFQRIQARLVLERQGGAGAGTRHRDPPGLPAQRAPAP
jgi:tetratricopeptide (TPR) repeat protein